MARTLPGPGISRLCGSGVTMLTDLYNHSCTLCPLHEHAQTVCVEASGQSSPYRAMIVGEAPGRNEDAQGIPFVGQAGKILDRALHECGFDRVQMFVTNAVKCRPRGNETPSDSDIDVCVSAYLTREIEAVNATALLACGNAAAQALLGETGVGRLRDTWHLLDSDVTRYVRVTWHPAYIIYRGGAPHSEAWREFLSDVEEFTWRALHGSS